MDRITTQTLISEVAERCDTSRAATGRCVKALLEAIVGHLAQERRVTLTGFGSFAPTIMAPRRMRDPRTGELRELDARSKIHFAVGKDMRDRAERALTRRLVNGATVQEPTDQMLLIAYDEDEDDDLGLEALIEEIVETETQAFRRQASSQV